MSRRGARPLTAKKDISTENITPNKPEQEEKQGFFSRIFGKKSKETEVKQTAAKVKRVRRKSKLAEDEILNDVAALKEEIKEAETNVKSLEIKKEGSQAVLPPPPPPTALIPPPPPPPPPPPAVKKAEKIQKVVGKTNVPSDQQAVDVHYELLNAIKNGAKKKLRKTSIRRSLGGTPIREKREYAPVTDAEIFAASVVIRDDSSSDESDSDNDIF